LRHLSAGEGEGEDGDVVFLSEVLGAAGDFLGVEEGELGKAVEAVEFAGGGAGFGDAVGEEDEGLAGGELAADEFDDAGTLCVT
jgi:hypothetical protein